MELANESEAIGQSSSQSATDSEVLSCSSRLANEDKDGGASKDKKKRSTAGHIVYNPKKPKWWTRLGNNRRDATKSQKRAMRMILDGEGTPRDAESTPSSNPRSGLRLPPIPYGSKLDWDKILPNSVNDKRDIWLELGFGRGENLQALLESKLWNENKPSHEMESSKFYLVGAEVSGVGIGCLCKRIQQLQKLCDGEKKEIEDHYSLYRPEMDPYASSDGTDRDTASGVKRLSIEERYELGKEYSNRLRIHTGDGYKLLPKIPDESLSAILVTFPDPFPKESDVNYRLVQHQTLLECHRILRKENGRLFLVTDHDGYHEWCHKVMHEVNGNKQEGTPLPPPLFKIQEPCPNRMEWLPAVSRYEQKGWDEGRSTKLTCWLAM